MNIVDDKTKIASSSVYEFIEDRSAVPMEPKTTDLFSYDFYAKPFRPNV